MPLSGGLKKMCISVFCTFIQVLKVSLLTSQLNNIEREREREMMGQLLATYSLYQSSNRREKKVIEVFSQFQEEE